MLFGKELNNFHQNSNVSFVSILNGDPEMSKERDGAVRSDASSL